MYIKYNIYGLATKAHKSYIYLINLKSGVLKPHLKYFYYYNVDLKQ